MLLKYLKRRNRKTDEQMADALCLTINHYKKLEREGWSCKPSNDPEEPYILYYDEKAIKYESYKPLKRWPKMDSKPKEVVLDKIKYKRIERPRLKLIEKMDEYGFSMMDLHEETGEGLQNLYKIINKGASFSYALFYKLWVLFNGDLEESDVLFEGEVFWKKTLYIQTLLKEGYIEDNGWREIMKDRAAKKIMKDRRGENKMYWNQVWG